MKPCNLGQVRDAVDGAFVGDVDASLIASRVSSDSRKISPGSLFFALRGENFDGHDYVADVLARGAVAAVVDRDVKVEPGASLIRVADVRRALGDLGAAVRRGFERCRVVGVAGSNGKTSTKHLVAATLGSRLRGTSSPKSFNNDIGVPLTIFDADPTQDFLVLEIGTNHPGEIRTLTRMATPDVGIITNCGEEHLEFLGDVAGVRIENASLVEGMPADGVLIVNGDDPLLLQAVSHYTGKIVRFGFAPTNDLIASDVQVHADATSFRLNDRSSRVMLPMIGRHNALNALAAIAAARAFDIADDDAIAALASSSKPEMRMERLSVRGVSILNDAYNANPASMRAGIETLLEFKPAADHGRRVAVLGDMRELGQTSERYHRELGQLLANRPGEIGLLVCVGTCSRWIAESAVAHGFEAPIKTFDDALTAAPAVAGAVRAGDLVLVKGSRGMRLEQIVEQLVAGE